LGVGLGEAAARAALAGVTVDRASTVAPRTPPKTIAAATTDANRRTRVLSMARSSGPNLKTGLDSGETFEALSLSAN
jgi:hypothetical protein